MKTISYFFGSLLLIPIVWWNQPYFGWSYCVLKGPMHETDFVEELRPLVISKSKPGSEEQIDLAFSLMRACVAKRGIKYCRYVGPDESGPIMRQQDPNRIPENQAHYYRHIVKEEGVGMFMLPNGDISGGQLTVMTYLPKDNFASSRDSLGRYSYKNIAKIANTNICDPGCSCNPNYDG